MLINSLIFFFLSKCNVYLSSFLCDVTVSHKNVISKMDFDNMLYVWPCKCILVNTLDNSWTKHYMYKQSTYRHQF